MTFKHRLFQRLKPLTPYYRLFKWLSVVQGIGTGLLPFVYPDIDTGVWLLSLSLLAFWLSNYALLRMAFHFTPDRKGVIAWFNNLWENVLVISWAILLGCTVYLCIKLVLYIWS